ncbi:hypothetical protein AQF52_5062 [Streptomyces venezuelae]|uniref:hypothetical protein n=1 Tax=Streptomyces gardneri TaxID=66892 RepID=UPI0006BCA28A|nr:hypothetical protein [Streptomyces gardneri]ALO10656.1 hypothetical protein AQF52_5062 [Streptomyces venezuelae]QPK47639.1 hypothetical protein H4W23_25400 [Streptomyces gardneri]WRK39082.1 hypothetical protein U0M97_25520 [Streptomyces venezuelae]CUM38867.1 hypothetical protein BN2537_6699 [Streptomyces venezuelae]
MTDEAARWGRYATLLPPAEAQEFTDCWQIGEQEAGLDLLVTTLLKHRVPISDTTRAEIAVAAEEWGVWGTLAPDLGRCVDGGPGDGSLKLIEQADAVRADPFVVVPWLACTRCDRTLARMHHREGWGDHSLGAIRYVLSDRDAPVRLFDRETLWDAVTELRAPCHRFAREPRY